MLDYSFIHFSFIPAISIAPLQVYAAARAGVEPTTLRLKVIVLTKAPARLTSMLTILTYNFFIQKWYAPRIQCFVSVEDLYIAVME